MGYFKASYFDCVDVGSQKKFAVLLSVEGGNQAVPLIINKKEMRLIASVLKNNNSDLVSEYYAWLLNMAMNGYSVTGLRIEKLENRKFYCKLLFKSTENRLSLIIKPANGVLLAILADLTIYISQTIVEMVALDFSDIIIDNLKR